jgi:hypothetical protein
LRNVSIYIVGGFHDPRYESLPRFLFSFYQFQVPDGGTVDVGDVLKALLGHHLDVGVEFAGAAEGDAGPVASPICCPV